jgi:uncharacterized protein YbjT (DUF2867 family)
LILVCGATGYIGRLLARSLLEQGETVRCLARNPADAADLAAAGAEVVRGDLLESAGLAAALEGVDLAY